MAAGRGGGADDALPPCLPRKCYKYLLSTGLRAGPARRGHEAAEAGKDTPSLMAAVTLCPNRGARRRPRRCAIWPLYQIYGRPILPPLFSDALCGAGIFKVSFHLYASHAYNMSGLGPGWAGLGRTVGRSASRRGPP